MNSYTLNHSKFLKKNINTFIVGVVLFFNLATSGSVSAKVSSLKSSSAKSISTSTQPQFSAANSSALEGNLFAFKEVKNGQYAFASLSYKSIPNIKGKAQKSGVVAVFQKVSGGWKWLRNIVVNSPSLNNTGDVYSAYGFALTPDESILAVAMDKKVALLNVNAAIKGNITPQYVSLDTNYLNSTGAIAVVAAKDNKHFFIADEYGRFKEKSGIGDIAIISATLMKSGTVKGQRLGYIKTGQNSIPSLNISPDGKTLYVPNLGASEAVSAKFSLSNNSILSKKCSNSSYNGSISIIDVDKAILLANQNIGNGNRVIEGAVLSHVASGCNPVRVAPSQDGKIVWVTVRGDEKIHENLIHVYDAELLRTNPEKAYLSSFNSNGESPIGIVTFSEDRYLAVSNANRFQVKDQNKKIVPTNVSIFDISNRESPKLITSLPGGGFPRDITTSYDSKSIYVAMWDEGRFKQITYKLK